MAQDLDLTFKYGSLIPVAHAAFDSDDTEPTGFFPGAVSMGADILGGFKMFVYGRTQQSGGMTKGQLATRVDAVGANTVGLAGTVTAATGETNDVTHISDTGNYAAVDDAVGKLIIHTDNNSSAGGAPEGEMVVIVSNNLNTAVLDPDYPFTAAPAVSDTYVLYSPFHHDDSANGDFAIGILGIVMGTRSATNYGWLQTYGINPAADYAGSVAALVNGDPVVAGAASIDDFGSDTGELWVGYALGLQATDQVASPKKVPIKLDLLFQRQPIAAI